MSERNGSNGRRMALVAAIALIGGLVAGAGVIYVTQGFEGNAEVASSCPADAAIAAAISETSRGEVAAVQPVAEPFDLSSLRFDDTDGQETTIGDFSGKTLLVNLWATWCVPCRAEMPALDAWRGTQARLSAMMAEKERLEAYFSALRLERQRNDQGYGPLTERSPEWLSEQITAVRERLLVLDAEIGPLAAEASRLVNPRWGPLMWAGNDKSHLARQIEASADIYTARVSNFLHYTPFVTLRSPRGSLPHDHATPQDRGLEAAAHEMGVDGFGEGGE